MKEEIKKELEDLGVNLNDLPARDRSGLPEDYFAKMQASVLSELEPAVSAAPAEPSLWSQWLSSLSGLFTPKPALAFAGIAAAILAGFLLWPPATTNDLMPLANLNEETLDVYLENNLEEFDEDLIFELFAEADDFSLSTDIDQEEIFIDEALDDLDFDQIEELL